MVTSLVGTTPRANTRIPGEIRIGSFDRVADLKVYLKQRKVCCVIDATHPFARFISEKIVVACTSSDTPFLRLERSAWPRHSQDHWIEVDTINQAVRSLPRGRANVFLSLGPRHIKPFRIRHDLRFLVRSFTIPTFEGWDNIFFLEGCRETTTRKERHGTFKVSD